MRATLSTPGTHRLTDGISIMNAHTRSGGAATLIRFSISISSASVQCTVEHGFTVRPAIESVSRRAAAHHGRHDASRRQRPDGTGLVRVPRGPDLAQWRTKARLGE